MSNSCLPERVPTAEASAARRAHDERLPFLWPGLRRAFGSVFAVIAMLVLQLALSSYYWIADPEPATALAPVWDVPVIVLLLAGLGALRRGPRRLADRIAVLVLTVVVFLYFLIGLGQGFALREFGYDVVLRLHIAYVPELFRMMYGAEPLGWFVFYVTVLVVGVAAVIAVLYGSVRHLQGYARSGRYRPAAMAAVAVVATAAGAAAFGMNGPMVREAYTQIDLAINLDKRMDGTARGLEKDAAPLRTASPFARPGAERPDILVFVIESYGDVLFRADAFSTFPAWLAVEGEALTQAGYHIASKNMGSPVFGGSSWLAGTSLMCGLRIFNQKRFQAILDSDVKCLPAFFNDAGYHTVVAAGNIKFHQESYARTLPYQRYYIRDDFGYRGPRMGWSFMPDQYVIDFVNRREIEPWRAMAKRPPLFASFILTSSHHPWAVIPPYLDDWSKLGDGSIYAQVPKTEFSDNQFVGGGNHYQQAYRASIEYSLHTVSTYLQHLPADDHSVIFILGDHQPRRPVARMKGDPWYVPIHVLSRDPTVVERFARVGYRPGTAPVPVDHPAGLEEFPNELFTVYGGGIKAAPARK